MRMKDKCQEKRRKSPSPSWLGRSGDRSRKIRHITLRYLLRRAPCGALLGFRGASRAAPPRTVRPANRRKCLRFALMDAWYFQIAPCYVHDFSCGFRLVFPRHPWRGKPRTWNHRSIFINILRDKEIVLGWLNLEPGKTI